MILIIDNYDSFTYNLVQIIGNMGREIVVRRNDAFTLAELAAMPLEAIVISPGPGEPTGAGLSMQTISHFREQLPILGICLGHQAIGACFGAQVVRADNLMHGKTSPVYHNNDPVFNEIDSPFPVMRYHSLLLERESMPPELEIIAETAAGEIMAIRHRQHRHILGLQFHPESYFTPAGEQVLANFIVAREADVKI